MRTRDLATFGEGDTEALKITDIVYQARGVANAQMVITPAGNVLIDTGLPQQADRLVAQLKAVSDAPITHFVASHAHADHYGAYDSFIDDNTTIITHADFPEYQKQLYELFPFQMPRNRMFFPGHVPAVPRMALGLAKKMYPLIEPDILVDDTYEFEVGGVQFEVISTPSAEGADAVSVWLPQHKILFTGDLFGHMFPMWPNITTIRGERHRFMLPYVDSLNKVLELDPEIIVPSHYYPVTDKEEIREGVTLIRDAVLYVHNAVVAGINEGKDVYTLMREIKLPPELQVSEGHGKVSWGVRSIWEGYLGWFHMQSATEMYPVPASDVYPDLVAAAGGVGAVTKLSQKRLETGKTVEALHLSEIALTAAPRDEAALRAKLAAYEKLLEESNDENHYEVFWLRDLIKETRAELGMPEQPEYGPR
jgi:alkyl sulfatase BDS1-like metallo-beta-lactamase superfamily hydrolase